MEVPTAPWTHVHIDHVGPFPTTNNGKKYILVIIDRFTRYAEAIAVDDINAIETAKIIIDYIICRHGVMIILTSDRGSAFTAHIAGEIFKILGIQKIKTTAHHPQSNGVVEIFNKTLKTTLKIWTNENQNDWDEYLQFVMFSYNTAFHSLMKETPFFLCHGRQARLVTDNITQLDLAGSNSDVHGYAYELTQRLAEVHHRVREILENVNADRAEMNEINLLPEFNIGDKVLLYDPTTNVGLSKKLVRRWRAIYIIIEKLSEVTLLHYNER